MFEYFNLMLVILLFLHLNEPFHYRIWSVKQPSSTFSQQNITNYKEKQANSLSCALIHHRTNKESCRIRFYSTLNSGTDAASFQSCLEKFAFHSSKTQFKILINGLFKIEKKLFENIRYWLSMKFVPRNEIGQRL